MIPAEERERGTNVREEELRGERRRRLNSCAPSPADVGRPSVRRATCLEWIASWGCSADLLCAFPSCCVVAKVSLI